MTSFSQPVVPLDCLTRRTACRVCGGTDLELFLSLGELPLANSFLTAEQVGGSEPRFPLEVYFCCNCSLVQLLHVVDPKVLFSNYVYRTGTNQTIVRHNQRLAEAVISRLDLTSEDLVVEVASNDGSLLSCFRSRGIRTLGIEPAKNIAEIARQAGISTIEEFFNSQAACSIVADHGLASAVIANNVLAHVDTTVDFLIGCKRMLRANGCVVIEVPYVAEMLARLEYDTIYHEHLCYFSIHALQHLFAEAGLVLEHVDLVTIHGGSLRLWARHADHYNEGDSVRMIADQECKAGLDVLDPYRRFATRVANHRTILVELLEGLKAQGKFVAGYGAPAKGNTMLCYCNLDSRYISYTVDRSPLKVGLYTPGTHIPVVPVDWIFHRNPDYILILAWNFADEIMQSLQLHEHGGRFILPIPEPRVL